MKKRGGLSTKGQRKVNKFEVDDTVDVNLMTSGLNDCIKHLLQSVQLHLPMLISAGVEKKEKNSVIKQYHDAAKNTVEARLKLGLMTDAVQSVYEDMNLEQAAAEMNVTEFFDLLDRFQEDATAEVEKRFENVDDNTVDQDDGYQGCLELLNTFVERSKSGEDGVGASPSTSSSGGKAKRGKKSKEKAEARHSEGLEALTEYIPTRDPITKKVFEDPYVNRLCGHVYDYKSIAELIQGGNIKCPYPGCRNTKRLNISDLEKDENMARKIAERIEMGDDIE